MRLSALLAPDIRQLLEDDPEQVRELLEEIHPEDLADIVSELEPEHAALLLARMPAEGAAPIFERLQEHEQEEVAEQMKPESMALIASEMAPDDRADLFSILPPGVAENFLQNLEKVDPQAAEGRARDRQVPGNVRGSLDDDLVRHGATVDHDRAGVRRGAHPRREDRHPDLQRVRAFGGRTPDRPASRCAS